MHIIKYDKKFMRKLQENCWCNMNDLLLLGRFWHPGVEKKYVFCDRQLKSLNLKKKY